MIGRWVVLRCFIYLCFFLLLRNKMSNLRELRRSDLRGCSILPVHFGCFSTFLMEAESCGVVSRGDM